jgi:hypothetical protein
MTVKGFVAEDDVEALFRDKLKESGITEVEAHMLGMSPMTGAETGAAGFWKGANRPALKIPYFDPITKNPSHARPHWPDFYRVRALRMPAVPEKGFKKYLQPAHTGVCAYFPRVAITNWAYVFKDYASDLIITEGELKAAKACLMGFPTVGLGGVHNYKSNFPSTPLIADLEVIPWARRVVYIAYDSDLLTNPNVVNAALGLADELEQRGAVVKLLTILGEGKFGLDDFLIAYGKPGLDGLMSQAVDISVTRELFRLNEKYAVLCEGYREAINKNTGEKLKADQIIYLENDTVEVYKPTPDGKIKPQSVKVGDAWFSWPLRDMVRKAVYEPAHPPLTTIQSKDGIKDFNVWQGWRVKPEKGDVSLFLELVDFLFTGADDKIKNWFLNWLAYPIQNPGAKHTTAVLLYGHVHGTGKTLIADTMEAIYGAAAVRLGQSDLDDKHNSWAEKRCFISCDDITGIHRRETSDRLKTMVTQAKVRINPKYINAYELDDHANWYFTSNRANALYIDRGDRRFFVWEVPEKIGKRSYTDFYKPYGVWLKSGCAAPAIFDYFLTRDLSGFEAGDAAPTTAAKEDMRKTAATTLEIWAEELRARPEEILRLGEISITSDLVSMDQLKICFAEADGIRGDDRNFTTQMGTALKAAGIPKVYKGNQVYCPGRKTMLYYAVRNADRWVTASLEQLQQYILNGEKPKKTQKY